MTRIADEEEQEDHDEGDQTLQRDDSPFGVTTRSQKKRRPETRGSSSSRQYMNVEHQDSRDEDDPKKSNLDVVDLCTPDEEGHEYMMIGVATRYQKRRQPEEEGGSSIRDFDAEENRASQHEDDWTLQYPGSSTEESLSHSDDAEFTSRAETFSLPAMSTRSQRKTEPAADRSIRTEEPRRSSRLRR
ncbi:uncharacterized protein [Engystomops pustulosus]|uniref:uncharacterized protein isoform X2 n=1 Tax=Engystomops pustulosus TaxID=76066 RepID=UPI003AFA9240